MKTQTQLELFDEAYRAATLTQREFQQEKKRWREAVQRATRNHRPTDKGPENISGRQDKNGDPQLPTR